MRAESNVRLTMCPDHQLVAIFEASHTPRATGRTWFAFTDWQNAGSLRRAVFRGPAERPILLR